MVDTEKKTARYELASLKEEPGLVRFYRLEGGIYINQADIVSWLLNLDVDSEYAYMVNFIAKNIANTGKVKQSDPTVRS